MRRAGPSPRAATPHVDSECRPAALPRRSRTGSAFPHPLWPAVAGAWPQKGCVRSEVVRLVGPTRGTIAAGRGGGCRLGAASQPSRTGSVFPHRLWPAVTGAKPQKWCVSSEWRGLWGGCRPGWCETFGARTPSEPGSVRVARLLGSADVGGAGVRAGDDRELGLGGGLALAGGRDLGRGGGGSGLGLVRP